MRRIRKMALAAIVLSTSAALGATAPASSAPAPSQLPASISELLGSPSAYDDPAGAITLVRLVNAERARVGLPPLSVRSDLTAIAQGHSRRMAAAGNIWHNDALFTRATHQLLGASLFGENVSYDGSGVAAAHAMLMASPHHRDNILDPRFTVAGFAVTVTNGTVYVTEDFAQVAGAAPAAPTPATVAPPPTTPPPPPPTPTTVPPPPPTTVPPTTVPPTTEAPATTQAPTTTVAAPRPLSAPDASLQTVAYRRATPTPVEIGAGVGRRSLPAAGAVALVLLNALLALGILRMRTRLAALR